MLFPFKVVRRIVLAVVLAVLLVIGSTGVRIWWTARADDRPRSDAIVVLGAAQFDGRPSAILRSRLNHAKRLYDADVAPRVLTVGGGQEGDRTTEAAAGETYLTDQGVPSERILAVPEGTDTLSSLQALAEVMDERGWTSAVLVTDPWHSFRSREMAEDLGLEAATSPTRSGPSVLTRATQLRYIWRETGAYLYYKLGLN